MLVGDIQFNISYKSQRDTNKTTIHYSHLTADQRKGKEYKTNKEELKRT